MTLDDRFLAAVALEKTGEFNSALTEYEAIIIEDNTYREAYINLGSIYFKMNRYKEALKCYLNAAKIKSDHVIYFNIGSILYKTGNYKKAVIQLEKSKKINPSFVMSSLVTGLCFSRLMNIKAAEKNFYNVLKVVPANRVALTALAIIYYNEKRYSDAVYLLDKLLLQDNKNVKIHDLKSTALFKMGKDDKAIDEIKEVAQISERYAYFNEFIKTVPVEVYTDKYGTIEDKITLLKEKSIHDDDSLISLSLCHLFKGETNEAIDYLFEARKRRLN